MIPRIIHQTSKTYNLSVSEKAIVNANKNRLPDYTFKLYNDEDNRKIVEKYFPHYLLQYDRIQKGVAKSDIARCMYLYLFGGWYCDTDYRWIRHIPSKYEQAQCILPVSLENERLGNAIMASEARHPFWKDFIDHIFQSGELSDLKEHRIEKVTGPEGLSTFYDIHKEKYESLILFPEKSVFHPRLIKWYYKGGKQTLGVHYCFGSWRTNASLFSNLKNLIRKIIITVLIWSSNIRKTYFCQNMK